MRLLPIRDERKCGGFAYGETDSTCPSEVGYNWRYGDGVSFPDARKGLTVKCMSERGMLRIE